MMGVKAHAFHVRAAAAKRKPLHRSELAERGRRALCQLARLDPAARERQRSEARARCQRDEHSHAQLVDFVGRNGDCRAEAVGTRFSPHEGKPQVHAGQLRKVLQQRVGEGRPAGRCRER
jgi:hypothetical protein